MNNFYKKLNLPNKLTLMRIIFVIPLIFFISFNIFIFKLYNSYSNMFISFKLNLSVWPFVVFFVFNIFILTIFILAMVTDYYDGKIARSQNLVSTFGKLWDPIADKLITTATLIYLSIIWLTPYWVVILFILRDIIVDGCRGLLIKNNQDVSASFWGKAKTMILSIGIVLVLLFSILFHFMNLPLYINNISWWFLIINIPIFVSLFFSCFSGYLYIKKAWKFMF
ncbi:CDP-diacylglycerol--glycerol-3-phosphate 3-phosphatidyltransferase [Mycoplasmopsis felis]|uniref:CDP-diacylglycerol--glycerol-3-phosphate 3-phosphatidyltransferase n=1 Tax=Mycoplasmopsis felis TaxID=33923 RepID=UPI002AFF21AE|nr:CDP-diacylglycerol--glycerol-3-phosphate 3-phosphatidyltransferase [Mycoplasmopsis felis]WQQ05697.1 CDP-diacylglycerol--glycerol-3-phosphate 3-phosphatidyltransferase [Mycoplasmopsis felis]WQQ07284.1 CDP-diacylglycerol--glycerol-3-phosphate 3-phosphatidyltransferase [Mycoplasmopsis felis]WQQ10324.1 CDP-diacylglycerol--glycerol-3-phosphate 3-phosphatidyltransferase [Mycoplasmopsis felis]WQQ11181.1 CDP-diacylglycerol--glycerol-3-phosphate 3-phosphatidyltransferase [Mycoplasmopsis felis]